MDCKHHSCHHNAQQRLHFLRVLRKNNVDEELLITFYTSTIQSILLYCNTVWFSNCTVAERQRLQRLVRTAEKIIVCPLSSLKDLHTSRCLAARQSSRTAPTLPPN